MNGDNATSYPHYWLGNYASGQGYRYAFFRDGTGLYDARADEPARMINWTQTGPATLLLTPRYMFGTATQIEGTIEGGTWTAAADVQQSRIDFILRAGQIT